MPKRKPEVNKKSRVDRFWRWLKRHKLDTSVLLILLTVSFTVSAINMSHYPQRFEDEGTYTSQAWAIREKGQLTHYTYWYDHPPLGWIQMAAHSTITDANDRYSSAITAGREFMLLLHLATIVLLFGLARRLGIGTIATAIGVLLYALSPLVVEFSRYALLDNVALPWLLAAFFLALSPRRHFLMAVASALCMAVAILSKETFVILVPVLLYGLWTAGDKRNRRFSLASFLVVLTAVSGFYILYAILKNELFPGEGHVSLLGTLAWQLFGRAGSGSIFNSDSGTRGLVEYWLNIDYWLMLAGAIALPFAFFYRQLRVAAFALLIGFIMLLRTGYLPFPYIIILLPFAVLVLSGVLDKIIIKPLRERNSTTRSVLAGTIALLLIIAVLTLVIPAWQPKLKAMTTVDEDASSRQAVAWIDQNIPRESRLVVESALWIDLETKGFKQPEPVWLYKTETDPSVTKEIGGWQGIDFVILNGPTLGGKDFDKTFPTVNQAIQHGELVADFGRDNEKIIVYKVRN